MKESRLLPHILLVLTGAASLAMGGEGQTAAVQPVQATIEAPDGSRKPMWLVHGEWFSAGGGHGGRGVEDVYRGGVELRYTWRGHRLFVAVDGQAPRLSGVEVSEAFGQDALREAVAGGVSPLTIFWRRKSFEQLPAVPEAIEAALQPNVSDEPFDFGIVAARIPCLTALSFSVIRGGADPRTLRSLSMLTRLTSLRIHWINAEMPTLEPLAGMKSLRVLSLKLSMRNVGWFAVPSLAPLAPLPIEALSISGQVSDAHFQAASRIGSLVSLKCLGALKLTDPACIGGMREIRQLELMGGRGITHLGPFGQLTKLEALRVSGARGIRDLAPLAGLTGLRELRLMGTFQTTDLSPLARLASMRRLELWGFTGVTDIAPLGKMAELTHLAIRGLPRVRNFAPVIQLQRLTSLVIGRCDGLIDLGFLSETPDLRELELSSDDGVADLGAVAGAKGLRRLTLTALKNVRDLAPLAQIPRLEALILFRCPRVTDLGPLAGLGRLDTLRIGQCSGVEDLRPLARMAGLRRLNLYMCPNVADLSPLRHCARLEEINLATCKKVTDVTPLRPAAKRGAIIHVPRELRPQLEQVKATTDF